MLTISNWTIYKDYKIYSKKSNIPLKTFFNLNFYVNIIYRLSHLFFEIRLFPLAKILWLINRIIFSIDIDPGARLAGGLEIIHGIGIVIGRYVESKGPIKIYQGATIGGNSNKTKYLNGKFLKQPLLNSEITIGINAVVVGPIIIDDNVIIGSNAVVTKDVGKNIIIVGNNKVLRKQY